MVYTTSACSRISSEATLMTVSLYPSRRQPAHGASQDRLLLQGVLLPQRCDLFISVPQHPATGVIPRLLRQLDLDCGIIRGQERNHKRANRRHSLGSQKTLRL